MDKYGFNTYKNQYQSPNQAWSLTRHATDHGLLKVV